MEKYRRGRRVMICDSMPPSQVCCGGGHRREMTRKPVTGTRTHVVSGHVNSGGFNTTAWFPTGQCIPDEVAPSVTRGSASASDVNAPVGSPGVEVTERKMSFLRRRAA